MKVYLQKGSCIGIPIDFQNREALERCTIHSTPCFMEPLILDGCISAEVTLAPFIPQTETLGYSVIITNILRHYLELISDALL